MTTFGYYGTGGTYDTTGGYYGWLWEIKTLPQAGGTVVSRFADAAYGMQAQDVKHTSCRDRSRGRLWDAVGNLTQRVTVYPTSATENFTYDFLDRLTGVSGAYTQSYTYNQIGNLTSMTTGGTTRTYTYDATKPHAVDAISNPATSYTYDANGNMNVGTARTWNVENQLTSITKDGITTTCVYDGDGNRVKKTVGGTTTIYVNKYYEKTGSTITTNYYLGNRLIAIKEGDTLRYVHQDSLTSTSAMSNSSGTLDSSINYLPFGTTRSGSVNTDRKFTGQRLDSTSLYYYNARYYDADIGRFISADTIVPDYKNPQGLNRYSYVQNNPLKYNDPTGHYWSNPLNTFKGIGLSIYNSVKAVKDMVVNPVQTAQNFINAVSNAGTGGVFKAIANDYATKWSTEVGRGEIIGEIALTALTATAVATASGSSKAVNISKAFEKETSMAYRYVSEDEFAIIQKTGKIPNTDKFGKPKDIFITTNRFETVSEAENSLLIGAKDPGGPLTSPQYGIAFNQNSVSYNYASAWRNNGTVITEMTTQQAIPYSYSWELNSSCYYNYYNYYGWWGY